ncbi:histidine phosphatase family protein [Sandaracinus amylolyticus]|uniref:histidine phosphatase family protein n=1 Tax=Sandaracinus amylolyticus TaxID=927083 RepID=UPI00069E0915|nr:histidine phosphatase family protein [Sandaracinus amylolyticus]
MAHARLVLIRHGQASAGSLRSGSTMAGDYDRLSELGREQARRLGPWLARWARDPAHVLVGPRVRHRETYEEALSTARDAGATWPEPEAAEGLDEHHGIQLVHHVGAELVSRPDDIGELARAAFSAKSDPTKHWLRMFKALMIAWARGEVGHEAVEPWLAFRTRVRRVLEDAATRNGTVIAFTSGGAIGAAIGEVLGLDHAPGGIERTLDLCWSVRNASVHEIHVGERGATLLSFNGVSHLDRDDLITMV